MWLGLCELRLMNDRRWPWLVLVPQRPGIEEIHDLTPLDQAMVTFETNMVAQALKNMTGCSKINSGALGNIVRQLHVHIIARSEGDPGWPGPVWGHGSREPYRRDDIHQFCQTNPGGAVAFPAAHLTRIKSMTFALFDAPLREPSQFVGYAGNTIDRQSEKRSRQFRRAGARRPFGPADADARRTRPAQVRDGGFDAYFTSSKSAP